MHYSLLRIRIYGRKRRVSLLASAASASQPNLVGLTASTSLTNQPHCTVYAQAPVSQRSPSRLHPLLSHVRRCAPNHRQGGGPQRSFNWCRTCKGPRTMAKRHVGDSLCHVTCYMPVGPRPTIKRGECATSTSISEDLTYRSDPDYRGGGWGGMPRQRPSLTTMWQLLDRLELDGELRCIQGIGRGRRHRSVRVPNIEDLLPKNGMFFENKQPILRVYYLLIMRT